MIRRHALPAFLAVSVLLHGIALITWPGDSRPDPRPGASLRVSLLPPNSHAVRQTQRGTARGRTGHKHESGLSVPVSDAHASVRTSREHRKTVANRQAGDAGSRKVTAAVASRATGSTAQARLRRFLAHYFYYPELAIRYGWQGTVRCIRFLRKPFLSALFRSSDTAPGKAARL